MAWTGPSGRPLPGPSKLPPSSLEITSPRSHATTTAPPGHSRRRTAAPVRAVEWKVLPPSRERSSPVLVPTNTVGSAAGQRESSSARTSRTSESGAQVSPKSCE
jgi:hypothetical protein